MNIKAIDQKNYNRLIFLIIQILIILFCFIPDITLSQVNNDFISVTDISEHQDLIGTTTATIYASINTDMQNISKVWALIKIPDQGNNSRKNISDIFGNNYNNCSDIEIELKYNNGRYEAVYNDFNIIGVYNISIFAMDWTGNISIPKWTSVRLISPYKKRAIIIANKGNDNLRWISSQNSAKRLFNTLISNKYNKDDIYVLSSEKISEIEKQQEVFTKKNLRNAITQWAWNDTLELFIYFAGKSIPNYLSNNISGIVTGKDIGSWLNDLQIHLSGKLEKLIVVMDFSGAANICENLKASENMNRICIFSSNCNEGAHFIENNELFFSKFFINSLQTDSNLKMAFLQAKNALAWDAIIQYPVIDANGNGVLNETQDFEIIDKIDIFQTQSNPGNNPVISKLQAPHKLNKQQLYLAATGVIGDTDISSVYALMLKPDAYRLKNKSPALQEIIFNDGTSPGNYYLYYADNEFNNIINLYGPYNMAVFAEDKLFRTSNPYTSNFLSNTDRPDPYESDNDYKNANWIYLTYFPDDFTYTFDYFFEQNHNFHEDGDEDWVKFYAKKDQSYVIEVHDVSKNCDPVIEIYESDGKTLLADLYNQPIDIWSSGKSEHAQWHCKKSALYYARIRQCVTKIFGCNASYGYDSGYKLSFYVPEMPIFDTLIYGLIKPPNANARVDITNSKENSTSYAFQDINGIFSILHYQGITELIVTAAGYLPFIQTIDIKVSSLDTAKIDDITLTPIPEKPVVSFDAKPLTGTFPLSVSFTNNTTLSNSWLWDFGDNITSSDENPVHVYEKAGIYSVKLIAKGEGGESELIKKDYIEAGWAAPTADFLVSNSEGRAPLTVDFKDQSIGEINTRLWDFGDGNTDDCQNPVHTYDLSGNHYSVSLKVTGPGGSNTKFIEDAVFVEFDPPVAIFKTSTKSGVFPLEVFFTNNSTGVISDWFWDFGDGTQVKEKNSKHIYSNPGTYYPQLKVIGPGGESFASDTIIVKYKAPEADFKCFPTSGLIPLTVNCTDQSKGTIDSWLWDFGDLGKSSEQNPYHIYKSPGTYSITLTVSGPGGKSASFHENYISQLSRPLNCDFSVNSKTGTAPFKVQFYDKSTGDILNWQWDFGDGTSSNLQSPEHIYLNPGSYSIKLAIKNEFSTDFVQINNMITVKWPEPVVNFTGNPLTGAAPLNVTFKNYCKNDINSYYWDFGDNSYSNEPEPVHIYNFPGKYNVSLKANGKGGENYLNLPDYIIVSYPKPESKFMASEVSGIVPLNVSFFDNSNNLLNNQITSWLWDFGDGNYSSVKNPDHIYENPGYYNVSLTVNGPGGKDTLTKNNFINALHKPPKADFWASSLSGISPFNVIFKDESSGEIFSRKWDFGDGAAGEGKEISYTYDKPGKYNVSLTVTGPGGSDMTMKKEYIDVKWPLPKAGFIGHPRVGIIPLTVKFTDTSTQDVKSWLWNFGNGPNSISTSQNPVYTYTQTGKFTVSLMVRNSGNKQTNIRTDYIITKCPKPSADFDVFINQYEDSLYVDFALDSFDNINSAKWDFGDGNIEYHPNPSHEYTASGTYSVSVTVSGPCGSATKVRDNIINLEEKPPKADFYLWPTSGTVPLAVSFTNNSKNNVNTWYWDFYDGNSSNETNPFHIYNEPGKYSISLKVTGSGGEDTKTLNNYIVVYPKPETIADFYVLESTGTAPFNVQFKDTSFEKITGWYWDFGDKSTSDLQNPNHVYELPGLYTVNLTVSSDYGSNSKIMYDYIHVNNPPPVSNFTVSLKSGTVPFEVNFYDNSKGSINTWLWNFGDGNTSNLKNPSHTFTKPGEYIISLTVTAESGYHQASMSDKIIVYPQLIADFTVSSLNGIAPFTVKFQDISNGIIEKRLWNFGDNTSSLQINPVKTYDKPGRYNVSLTITGINGSNTKSLSTPVIVSKPSFETITYKSIDFINIENSQLNLNNASDIAGNGIDSFYIADTANHRIIKLYSTGKFLKQWGMMGNDNTCFLFPTGITVSKTNHVFVADSFNHRIQKFSSDGEFISAWGKFGSNDGEFFWPTKLETFENYLYVVDENNNRIQQFMLDGTFVRSWGQKGSLNGHFNCPSDIAIDNFGVIYIADKNNYRIQKFSSNGEFIGLLKDFSLDQIVDSDKIMPVSISLDNNLNFYINDQNSNKIIKLTEQGEIINSWEISEISNNQLKTPYALFFQNKLLYITFQNDSFISLYKESGEIETKWPYDDFNNIQMKLPFGLALDSNNNFYAIDYGNTRIHKYNINGSLIDIFSNDSDSGELKEPVDIVTDSFNMIYILDKKDCSVKKFSPEYELLNKWGSNGVSNSQFISPLAIAISLDDKIYVADTYNHRIQKFSSEGNFILKWGIDGSEEGMFKYPSGISVDNKGYVYVCDYGNRRIQKFNSLGKFESLLPVDNFIPRDITVDKYGFVYVTDIKNSQIQKFNSNGNLIAQIGKYGFEPGKLNMPSYLFVSSNGNIFVSDTLNNRIQKFRALDIRDLIYLLQAIAGLDNIPAISIERNNISTANKLGMKHVLDLFHLISNLQRD